MGTTPDNGSATRRRDAARTRRALLDAARHRFAHDGYAAATVRDIAEDAGVNVALIARYFSSKAGLFEACLDQATGSGETLTGSDPAGLAAAIAREVTGPRGTTSDTLLLLLRSSGDERAERSRVGALCALGERLAAAAGRTPDDADGLLRAQLVLAAAVGAGVLRSKGGPEPLASATEADLAPPLHDLVTALLHQKPGPPPTG